MELNYYHEYASLEDRHWWFQARRSLLRNLIRRWAGRMQPRRILDVGCGTGSMLEMLREFGPVEGLDSTEVALQYCRKRLGEKVPLHRGDIGRDLPAGPYDLVTAFDVLEHLPDGVAALRSIRDILSPDGWVVCTVPACPFLWSPHDEINHHYRRYTRTSLEREIKSAGYRLHWMSYFNTLLFPPVALVRLVRKLLPADFRQGSDFKLQLPSVNAVLRATFLSETLLLNIAPLPFGVSLVAVFQR